MAYEQRPFNQNQGKDDRRPSPPHPAARVDDAPPKLPIEILKDGIKTNNDIDLLKKWGEYLSKKGFNRDDKKPMTTSQIRRFFGEIKRIQADFENCKDDIILLDPKIAYAVGRAKKDGETKMEDFYNLLRPLILNINVNKDCFKKFVNIVESIVAYHKAAGGQ